MDPLQAAILGFTQGVTEWLPVSSTGHLRIAAYFFGLTVPLLFDVLLHFGTLVVILVFFRKDIVNILGALVRGEFKSENGRLIPLIIAGTVPTILIGFFVGNTLDKYFNSLPALGGGFIASAVILYGSKFGIDRKENISYVKAILIGTAQGIAIVPSISRSGITIAAALLLGIRREKAFKFSFLLSVPSIVGALGLTLYEQSALLSLAGIGLTEIAIGITVSIVVSFLALKLLWRALSGKKFHLFAIYCAAIGTLLIALTFIGF